MAGKKRFTPDEELRVLAEYVAGSSLNKLATKYRCAHRTVSEVLKRNGGTVRGHTGTDSHKWSGGRAPTGDGYIRVWVAPDDPFATMVRKSDGHYVLEHRLVVAKWLGRPLTSKETVHHKNGNRSDNRIENLQLRHGNHGTGQVWRCGDCESYNVTAEELAA